MDIGQLSPAPRLSEMELKRFKRIIVTTISNELAQEWAIKPDVDVMQDFRGLISLKLVIQAWGFDVERLEHKYPSNWKEAFKERWFPAWLKRRYPVKYRVVVMEAKAVLPKIPRSASLSLTMRFREMGKPYNE